MPIGSGSIVVTTSTTTATIVFTKPVDATFSYARLYRSLAGAAMALVTTFSDSGSYADSGLAAGNYNYVLVSFDTSDVPAVPVCSDRKTIYETDTSEIGELKAAWYDLLAGSAALVARLGTLEDSTPAIVQNDDPEAVVFPSIAFGFPIQDPDDEMDRRGKDRIQVECTIKSTSKDTNDLILRDMRAAAERRVLSTTNYGTKQIALTMAAEVELEASYAGAPLYGMITTWSFTAYRIGI